jgi:hypothetical protein
MRYFYDDPLAAAWMAKHFGMLITIENDAFIFNDWEDLLDVNVTECYRGNYYIHPDSLSGLDPQAGDLYLLDEDDEGAIVITLGAQLIEKWEQRPIGKIIQRNGLAFHWPKEESDV